MLHIPILLRYQHMTNEAFLKSLCAIWGRY
nr:MAG TPA: hypothetical protein [Caudoviricetes sp.]